jgi:hypothetical protein
MARLRSGALGQPASTNGYAHFYRHKGADRNAYTNRIALPHTNCFAYHHTYAHAHCDTDTIAHANPDAYAAYVGSNKC